MAVRAELDILYAAGVRNVQFDDPNFACKNSFYLLVLRALTRTIRFLLGEDAQGMGRG